MAVFSNLYHVGQVLATLIEERHVPPLLSGTAEVAAPENPETIAVDAVRVTLLWTTPQPEHRNDRWERMPDGSHQPPPLTLTAVYLVTCYGQSHIGAHELLGSVLRTFHSHPVIELPLPSLPNNGEGALTVTQVPLSHELVEKIFSPLQIKHTAFALYQVDPIQLEHLLPTTAPGPLVKPGGLVLTGPSPSEPPVLHAVVPETASAGSRIRIDGMFADPPTIYIDGQKFTPADLVELGAGTAYALTLPGSLGTGRYRVSARVGDTVSRRADLMVVDASQATLSAPLSLTVSRLASLTLAGTNLGSAALVYAWPAAGISAPAEVIELTPGTVAATQVTIPDLTALTAGVTYRFAVKVGAVYTASVTLEVIA